MVMRRGKRKRRGSLEARIGGGGMPFGMTVGSLRAIDFDEAMVDGCKKENVDAKERHPTQLVRENVVVRLRPGRFVVRNVILSRA